MYLDFAFISMGDSPETTVHRRSFIKYGGAASVVALAGCTAETDDDNGEDDTVVIGSAHPLSGNFADTGTRMNNAIELAAMRKNDEGGIESLDGAEVEVIEGDTEGEQELGSEVANNLIDDGAHVLTGCFNSPVTNAAATAAEGSQVPFVISVAVDDAILGESPRDYVYRPQPNATQMARDHVDTMPQVVRDLDMEVETAGLFYIDDDFGQSVSSALEDFLPEEGIEVVTSQAIDFGDTADTQVTNFRDNDPDIVISTTYSASTQELISAMDNQDYRPPLLGGVANEAYNDASTLEAMGDTAEDTLMTNFALNPVDDRADEIREAFEDEFDQSFDANVAMSYVAGEVIIAAIEEAGSTDHDEINDTLSEITVEEHIAAMPEITFDESGENENALGPLFQVQDLQDVVVFPEEFAAADPRL